MGEPPIVFVLVGELTSIVSTTALSAASLIWILPLAPRTCGVANVRRNGVSGHTLVALAAGNKSGAASAAFGAGMPAGSGVAATARLIPKPPGNAKNIARQNTIPATGPGRVADLRKAEGENLVFMGVM